MFHPEAGFLPEMDEQRSQTSQMMRSQIQDEHQASSQALFNQAIYDGSSNSSTAPERRRQNSRQRKTARSEEINRSDLNERYVSQDVHPHDSGFIGSAYRFLKSLFLCYLSWLLLSHFLATTQKTISETPTIEFTASGAGQDSFSCSRALGHVPGEVDVVKFCTFQQQLGKMAASARECRRLSKAMPKVSDFISDTEIWTFENRIGDREIMNGHFKELRDTVKGNSEVLENLAVQVNRVIDSAISLDKRAVGMIRGLKHKKVNFPAIATILNSFHSPLSAFEPDRVTGGKVKDVLMQTATYVKSEIDRVKLKVTPCSDALDAIKDTIKSIKTQAQAKPARPTTMAIFASFWKSAASLPTDDNKDISQQTSMKMIIHYCKTTSEVIDKTKYALAAAETSLKSFAEQHIIDDEAWSALHLTDTVAMIHDIITHLEEHSNALKNDL